MMNAAVDSPLIEMPRDPALSPSKKAAAQEPWPQPSVHCAPRVISCGPLSVQLAPAEDAAQIHRLVQALLSGENARVRLLAFTGTLENGQSRIIGLRAAEYLATQHGFRVCVVDTETSRGDDPRAEWSIEDTGMAHTRISPSQSKNAGKLWLLNARETAELLTPRPGSKSPREQLLDLHSSFDYTILCAPTVKSSKSVAVLNDVEGVVLVIEAGKVRRQALENATRTIVTGNARLLGTVLTGRVRPIPERLFRWLRL